LRFMWIKPLFGTQSSYANTQLLLSNGDTEHTFSSTKWKDFQIILPKGSFHGRFFKEDGTEIVAKSVEIEAIGQRPLCDNFVKVADFSFQTAPPTSSPTPFPTVTAPPTETPDPIVRIQSMINKRYLWVAATGGFKASSDPDPWTNSRITLKKHECAKAPGFYHFDKNVASPCFLVVWENANGRRMWAENGKEWKNGIGTTGSNTISTDEIWFLEKVPCNADFPANTCALIRNAKNGRSIYDHLVNKVLGASPAGEPEYVWDNNGYRWHFMDLVSGGGLDVTKWAAEPMF